VALAAPLPALPLLQLPPPGPPAVQAPSLAQSPSSAQQTQAQAQVQVGLQPGLMFEAQLRHEREQANTSPNDGQPFLASARHHPLAVPAALEWVLSLAALAVALARHSRAPSPAMPDRDMPGRSGRRRRGRRRRR